MEPSFFHRLVGVPQVENARLIGLELGTAIDAVALDAAWNEAFHARMREGIRLRPGASVFLDARDRMHLPRAIATNGVTARAEWKHEACAFVVAHLAFRQEQDDRSSIAVADGMEPGDQPALGTPDMTGNIPF